MKKILICTDGSAFAAASYRYGAWFATRLNADVTVLCVTDIRSQQVASTGNWSGSIGIDASENLLRELVELEHNRARLNHQRAKLTLKSAEELLKAEGVQQVEMVHKTGFLVDLFHEMEAEVDLVVLGKRGETAEFASGHLGANVERIVRSSQKPCLITSREFQPIERVLLAYDGSKSCQAMVDFLTRSALFQGLTLHLLTVTSKPDAQKAIAQLNKATQQLQSAGFEPVSQVIQGEPEVAIARYVKDQAINLLLMGAYGHSRIRHLVIGSTTAQMLRSSQIPVLLFR
jgi:nucleotide-binding universal stress UspA family protein